MPRYNFANYSRLDARDRTTGKLFPFREEGEGRDRDLNLGRVATKFSLRPLLSLLGGSLNFWTLGPIKQTGQSQGGNYSRESRKREREREKEKKSDLHEKSTAPDK